MKPSRTKSYECLHCSSLTHYRLASALACVYVLTISCVLTAPANAQTAGEGTVVQAVSALVTDAYDGDTLTVEAALWPDLTWEGSVRVVGVDSPEIRGLCELEHAWAILARDYVRDLLIDETVFLTDVENDRYGGRVLAQVHLESGDNLADLLIANGLGRTYDGGARQGWCGEGQLPAVPAPDDESSTDDPNHPLTLYDDNGNGRISCAEARAHGIAPVYSWHPAYPYMTDGDGDGVVCE